MKRLKPSKCQLVASMLHPACHPSAPPDALAFFIPLLRSPKSPPPLHVPLRLNGSTHWLHLAASTFVALLLYPATHPPCSPLLHSPPYSPHTALTEFLFARHPRRVRAAKVAWEAKNDASLVDRITSELSGDYRKLALMMLKGQRFTEGADDDQVDQSLVKSHAERLHANKGVLDVVIEILSGYSVAHIRAVLESYEMSYNRSLAKDLGRFDGNVRNALLAMLQPPADWYAARLKVAFKGWGANHKPVCRIIGTMDKDEALALAAAYERKYQKPLRIKIKQECSGHYKRLAIAWVTVKDALEAPSETTEM
ncbi:MAG: hypothetical protein SGPRY_010507, partial [Prymnesium sp.]